MDWDKASIKKKKKYQNPELDGLNITKHRPWGDKENKLLREFFNVKEESNSW